MLVKACAFALLLLGVPGPSAAAVGECSRQVLESTGCPTVTSTLNPTDVTLTGIDNPNLGGPSNVIPRATTPLDDCADPASTTCARPFIATITAPVTLADIASFRPDPAIDHMEPNGWTIAGLDTNFYATGGRQVIYGVLLGRSAVVRFTPVGWHWSYGDGAAARHPFAGDTWAAQGVREFDATGTSHVYREYGTYSIDLDVDLAAEYQFAGGSWVEIDGVITLPANQLVISVGDAKTVLVERECTSNPAAPGC